MSRTIDTSNGLEGLSNEDLKYLHDRGRITDAELAEHLDVDEDELVTAITSQGGKDPVPLADKANTGTANTAGVTKEQLEAMVAKEIKRQLAELQDPNKGFSSAESSEEDEDDEEQDYDTMTNDELRAEIASRNEGRAPEDQLSLDGKKADLIATLRADDEEEGD